MGYIGWSIAIIPHTIHHLILLHFAWFMVRILLFYAMIWHSLVDTIDQMLVAHNAMRDLLKNHLFQVQQWMKDRVDKHRRVVKYAVRDIFLNLTPYKHHCLATYWFCGL